MADPQHTPQMDSQDVWTVRLYRIGLWITGLGLLWAAWTQFALMGGEGLAEQQDTASLAIWVVVLGISLSGANVHIYAKSFRFVMQALPVLGLVLMLGATHWSGLLSDALHWGGLGFLFVAYSSYAMKEQFCFRVYGMRLVPLILLGALIGLWGQAPDIAGFLLGLAGLLGTYLAAAKSRMPLHNDIGDKSKYQT